MHEQELTVTVPWRPTLLPKRLAQRVLIEHYACALKFPDFYSLNWDSFEEILEERAEQAARPWSGRIAAMRISRPVGGCGSINLSAPWV